MPTDPIDLFDRAAKEAREARELAPFAMPSARSRGRRVAESPDPHRTCFERDRDRVTHATAFRRLMHKTQVTLSADGDHARTRLSHSLEVCQVARSVGAALRLNEPLCEAIALAHDLGHPPFGHRGEWALNEVMQPYGGFRHNAQVLRVVDQLERRNPDYTGLNLTRELRESLLKHEPDEEWPAEFAPRPKQPLLEGQVVDLADSTAYNKHDLEDGLLGEMFTEGDLEESVELWRRARAAVTERHPGFLESNLDFKLRVTRLCNEVMGICIVDQVHESRARVAAAGVASPDEVRAHERMLIGHSPELRPLVKELQRFLYARFYRHPELQAFRTWAKDVIFALFHAYVARPAELSPWFRRWADTVGLHRATCDYLAGMTDRFAMQEHERLVGPLPAR
ncbi:MAG: dNTP triphosphohydrolase [Planctomycetota bacterium]